MAAVVFECHPASPLQKPFIANPFVGSEALVLLGKGAFGMVLEGKDAAGEPYAVKLLCEPSQWHAELAVAEYNMMAQLGSRCSAILMPYSLQTLGSTQACITMPKCEGSVLDYVSLRAGTAQQGLGLPEMEALVVFREMLRAAAHCHAQGIVHSDIKPANFLITKYPVEAAACSGPLVLAQGSVKMSDFGIAVTKQQQRQGRSWGGTPGFQAPESEAGYYHGPESNMFSLGVTLRALISNQHPEAGGFFFDSEVWDSVSEFARDLVARLTHHCVFVRPNAEAALEEVEEHLRLVWDVHLEREAPAQAQVAAPVVEKADVDSVAEEEADVESVAEEKTDVDSVAEQEADVDSAAQVHVVAEARQVSISCGVPALPLAGQFSCPAASLEAGERADAMEPALNFKMEKEMEVEMETADVALESGAALMNCQQWGDCFQRPELPRVPCQSLGTFGWFLWQALALVFLWLRVVNLVVASLESVICCSIRTQFPCLMVASHGDGRKRDRGGLGGVLGFLVRGLRCLAGMTLYVCWHMLHYNQSVVTRLLLCTAVGRMLCEVCKELTSEKTMGLLCPIASID